MNLSLARDKNCRTPHVLKNYSPLIKLALAVKCLLIHK